MSVIFSIMKEHNIIFAILFYCLNFPFKKNHGLGKLPLKWAYHHIYGPPGICWLGIIIIFINWNGLRSIYNIFMNKGMIKDSNCIDSFTNFTEPTKLYRIRNCLSFILG